MATNWGLAHLEQCRWYLDCPKNKMPLNEQVLKEQFEPGFSNSILLDVPPTKMKPNSSKKFTIAFALRHFKHKAIILMMIFWKILRSLALLLANLMWKNLQQRRLMF
jgi:hypothetical protein